MLQFYESRCGKYSLKIKLFLWNRVRLDTIQKDHIYHKSNMRHFIEKSSATY